MDNLAFDKSPSDQPNGKCTLKLELKRDYVVIEVKRVCVKVISITANCIPTTFP